MSNYLFISDPKHSDREYVLPKGKLKQNKKPYSGKYNSILQLKDKPVYLKKVQTADGFKWEKVINNDSRDESQS